MKKVLRVIMISLAAGLAVSLFATSRGREIRELLVNGGRSLLGSTGLLTSCCGETDDGDLQARIEETRRRLKEQLASDQSRES